MRCSSSLLRILLLLSTLGLLSCGEQRRDPLLGPVPARTSIPSLLGGSAPTGGVYTMTNGAAANSVLAFHRGADGSLEPLGAFATGGLGTGGAVDPLQSQNALVLGLRDRFLFAVNAGSNEITSFEIQPDGSLVLRDRIASGGVHPVSLATRGNLLFALNAADGRIQGFTVDPTGTLHPLAGSSRRLASGAAGASTIGFSGDGARLVVSERDSRRLEVFPLSSALGNALVARSSGAQPSGFAVTPRNQLVVAEAAGGLSDGAVSSYRFSGEELVAVSPSLDAGGMGTCRVALTSQGTSAFVANTGSDAVAELSVGRDGVLSRLSARAASTGAGTRPLDLEIVGDRFLYVLEGGSGRIAVFSLRSDGGLFARGAFGAGAASSGLLGLAAW